MISVINSVGAYHKDYVKLEVDRLQNNGYEVTEIIRTEKMRFGIFGEDSTDIIYSSKPK